MPSPPCGRPVTTRSHRARWASASCNNAVVGARHAQRLGRERVLIVDWDVHHGNGTQALVEHDATIRYVSLHQHPWYPGTGMADERGVGNVFNVPRGPGAPPERYVDDLWAAIVAATTDWRPTSCSSPPASTRCSAIPLGGFTLEPEHYAELTRRLRERLPAVPIVGLLEGGYVPARLADGVLAHAACPRLVYIARLPFRPAPPRIAVAQRSAWKPNISSCAPSIRSSSRGAGRAITGPSGSGCSDADGHEGWGEAAPTRFYGETAETVLAALNVYAAGIPDDPFDLEETERRWDSLLRVNAVGAGRALRRAARPRRQAAGRAGLPAVGARPRQGAALHLHDRPRHAGAHPRQGGRGGGVPDPQDQAGHRSRRRDPPRHPRRDRQGAPGRRQLRLDREADHRHAAGASGIRRDGAGAAAAAGPISTGWPKSRAAPPSRSSPTRAA